MYTTTRKLAALAVTLGLLLGSVGGGLAVAKKHGTAMKHQKQGAAMKREAAMKSAHLTG